MVGEHVGQEPGRGEARRLPVGDRGRAPMTARRHAIPRAAPRDDEPHRHEPVVRLGDGERAQLVAVRELPHRGQQRARAQRSAPRWRAAKPRTTCSTSVGAARRSRSSSSSIMVRTKSGKQVGGERAGTQRESAPARTRRRASAMPSTQLLQIHQHSERHTASTVYAVIKPRTLQFGYQRKSPRGRHFEEIPMTSRPVIDDLSSFWMPFTANRQFKAAPRLLEAAKGMYYRTHGRPRDARRLRGPVVRERRPRPRRDRRRDAAAAVDARLRADIPDGPPARVRGGHQGRRADAGRSRPHLLHELGFGIGRYRAEDRARVPPLARRRRSARG